MKLKKIKYIYIYIRSAYNSLYNHTSSICMHILIHLSIYIYIRADMKRMRVLYIRHVFLMRYVCIYNAIA
jgi:hypothetical protein